MRSSAFERFNVHINRAYQSTCGLAVAGQCTGGDFERCECD